MQNLTEGDGVIFYDSHHEPHDALITRVHAQGQTMDEFHKGYGQYPCLNLVIVSMDPARTDQYGQQIERFTSVVHRDSMPLERPAHCWEPKTT